jgi:hypothetical protein
MNYLDPKAMMESGNAPPQVQRALAASGYSGYSFNTGSMPMVANAARRDPREAYWKGSTPVLEQVTYNGETCMLPKLVPVSSLAGWSDPRLPWRVPDLQSRTKHYVIFAEPK